MPKALPIMFQGTHSDAGKSVIATAFCRIFSQDGFSTAPFKSQNMSLNSYITIDGKEIGRAQGVQAEAAGVIATTHMNPILIKPNRDFESQIVVHGKPYKNMKAMEYRTDYFYIGLKLIEESLTYLTNHFERIVIEGAGSPAEVNLNDRELVNMRVARLANAPVILIGDIDKGGVFASLVGTLQLLDPEDRKRVIGVIINKFRGDISLLEPGLEWFEQYTGKPVLGVVPYLDHLNIDAEDSLILDQYSPIPRIENDIDIAVIQYPKISNFTDIDPFFMEEDCHVRFVTNVHHLHRPDIIILPGSKNTIEDFHFLQSSGLAANIERLYRENQSMIFGICGGYQMLGKSIRDPFAMESPLQHTEGLSLLPIHTTITDEKTTELSEGRLTYNGKMFHVKGYEIHMGETYLEEDYHTFIQLSDRKDGCKSSNEKIMGTYFHGIFHNDSFRCELLNEIRIQKGLAPLPSRISYNQLREDAYDRLAEHVRKHVNIALITEKMVEFSNAARDLSEE